MNDFDGLLAQVLVQARALDLPVSREIDPHVRVNSRATTRFGCCARREGRYIIELSRRLLEAEAWACRQTLAHEVLHTCPGCRDHGARWQGYARRMNDAYGYHIARTGTCQELGVPDLTPVNYLVVCQSCGRRFQRARMSRLVQHPERYRCTCGGRLKRVF